MSTVTVNAIPMTRLRLTTRGRRVLATVAALPAIVALVFAFVSGGSALASRGADSGPAVSFSSVTVASGDTLWSIAQEIAPQADPRDVVDALVRLNAIEGATVMAGQRLAVPAEYDAH